MAVPPTTTTRSRSGEAPRLRQSKLHGAAPKRRPGRLFSCPTVCFFCLFHQLKKAALASRSHRCKCECLPFKTLFVFENSRTENFFCFPSSLSLSPSAGLANRTPIIPVHLNRITFPNSAAVRFSSRSVSPPRIYMILGRCIASWARHATVHDLCLSIVAHRKGDGNIANRGRGVGGWDKRVCVMSWGMVLWWCPIK